MVNMASSFLLFRYLASLTVAFLLFLSPVKSETIDLNFTVGWVIANPDGAFDKPTIGINGQWPIPAIRVTVGDRLILHVHNDLGNASTSLHFHGLFQNGTNHMDGATGVTQCPIPPGESFTYNIKVRRRLRYAQLKAQPRYSLTSPARTGTMPTTTASIQKAFAAR